METQQNDNTYIAITFGPITRVASYAEDTKGLWASSYLFSYIAKNVITPFKGQREFLLPLLNAEMDEPEIIRGAGVYPDRYVFKSEEGDFKKLYESTGDMYKKLAEEISRVIDKNKDKIEAYLKRTIKVYAFEKSFPDNDNIVKTCEKSLDDMECQDIYPQKEPVNYLQMFFEKVNGSFLVEDGFGNVIKPRLFEPIIKYSTIELNNKDYWKGKKTKYRLTSHNLLIEENIVKVERNKVWEPYHKYIAFVKSDGDNMTTTISSLKEHGSSAVSLSKALFEFNKATIPIISHYGGQALFLGGDDLLFFAPVRNGNNTIFSLLSDIEKQFHNILKQELGENIVLPTLSFGVSVSYFKHPMFEAVEKAEELLGLAKSNMNYTPAENKKNRIAWHLRKHNGQVYQSVVFKEFDDLYEKFKNLTNVGIFEASLKKDYLTSFTYWLEQTRFHLEFILSRLSKPDNKDDVLTMLQNYMDNSFDEPVHASMGEYKKKLIDYLIEHTLSRKDATEAIRSLYATLRFVDFLIRDKKDEEDE